MKTELEGLRTPEPTKDLIHYIVMSLGLFARKYKLTRREACNY